MTDIKTNFRKWVKLDEEINILQKKLNKLKSKKSEITPDLLKYMEKSNKEKIVINSNFNLLLKQKINYTTISKKYIHDTLGKFLNKDLSDEIINQLYENREKRIINNLEIRKN